MVHRREGRLLRPGAHLLDGLADGHLAQRPRVERAQVLGVLDDGLGRAQEVVQAELRQSHLLDAQLMEERAPVLGLERVAAYVLEPRREVAVQVELRLEVVGHRAGRALRRLLHPRRDKVLEDPEALPEGDPVLLGQLVQLLGVLLEERARGDVRLDVGAQVVEPAQLRLGEPKVLAIERELLGELLELRELALPPLDALDDRVHLLALPRVQLLRLELEPARRELLEPRLQLADALAHLRAQVVDLVLDALVEGGQGQLELLPARGQRPQLDGRARVGGEQPREVFELLEAKLLDGALLLDAPRLGLGLGDLVDRLRPLRERLEALGDEGVEVALRGRRAARHAELQRVREPLMLVLERRLERRERHVDAVDLLEVGQLLGLLAPLAQVLVRGVVLGGLAHALLDQILERAVVHAEDNVLAVLEQHLALELGEELARLLVDHQQRLHVAVGHVAEHLVHLVLAQRLDALAGVLALLGRLVKVAQALEARRDRDELLDLAVELHAQVLERGPQLQPPPLELELAADLRQVLVQALQAHLVLVLQRLEQLHVPVQPPPLHRRVVGLQRVGHAAQRLHLVLPLALLLEQRHLHQLEHLLAHLRVHLPQLAVLLRQPLRRGVQMLDVALELVRVAPGDRLAAAALARLGGGVGGQLLELVRVVEQQRLLRAHDLLLDRVVEVGDLLEDHAVAVELVRDVGVPLDRVGHLEAERRELAHLAQEEDQPVGVVHLQREVVLVDLHQLARQLQRQPRRGVLEIVLDVADPVGKVLLLEVVHVLQQVARLGLEALHALQVAQHHLGRLQRLPTLVGNLARQHDLLDRSGQVLADALPLAVGLAASHLKVLAQDLEVVLELAEQRLARRR